jgi:hypothetical protein
VAVHYRWHALHGRKVRQLYVERRSGREVAVVEAEPGVAIVLAAWMLDPAICATMSLVHRQWTSPPWSTSIGC